MLKRLNLRASELTMQWMVFIPCSPVPQPLPHEQFARLSQLGYVLNTGIALQFVEFARKKSGHLGHRSAESISRRPSTNMPTALVLQFRA